MRPLLAISASALLFLAGIAQADESSSSSVPSSSVSSSSSEMSSSSSSSSSEMSSSSAESSSSSSSASSSASSALTDGLQLNWGSLISAIQTGGTLDLSVITDATTVRFVTVSSLKANGNTNALDNALKKHESDIATLQASVSANAALTAKLEAADYSASQVVAVSFEADGSVTVYIDDRA